MTPRRILSLHGIATLCVAAARSGEPEPDAGPAPAPRPPFYWSAPTLLPGGLCRRCGGCAGVAGQDGCTCPRGEP